ncbi:hypothetical protein AAEK50_004867 [Serratia marcescens]|jgi:osmotically inducible lipoprotein OsmE
MFKLMGLFAIVSSMALSGCNTMSLLRDQQISNAFVVGADKKSVARDFGSPVAGPMKSIDGRGECFDYKHMLPNKNVTPFYVNYRNSDEKVVAFGPITCEEAMDKGLLNKEEQIRQVF